MINGIALSLSTRIVDNEAQLNMLANEMAAASPDIIDVDCIVVSDDDDDEDVYDDMLGV